MRWSALLAAVALVAAVAGWGAWQRSRAVSAEVRAEAAEALVAGYAEAARMRAVQDTRLAQLRDDAAALDRDLQEREGADAPLSDYMRDAADRLWP